MVRVVIHVEISNHNLNLLLRRQLVFTEPIPPQHRFHMWHTISLRRLIVLIVCKVKAVTLAEDKSAKADDMKALHTDNVTC